MWSRYVLKPRIDKYQQEARSLLGQHRQSLAYREIRTVKIDCSFLPDSQWGILGQEPAWLLYLDVKISQPKDCSLTSANVDVIFQSHNPDCQSNTSSMPLGPIITEYFGPQRIDGQVIDTHGSMVGQDSSCSLGQSCFTRPMDHDKLNPSSDHGHGWTLPGCSWPLAGDISGLPRRVEWLVEDAVACGELRLAVVLQHDMKPFSIAVRIDGRLKGEKNKRFRFFRPMEQSSMNRVSCIVTPSSAHGFQLDDIASRLDYEMTTLNIQKYRNTAQMLLLHKEPLSRHTNICL
ncbi:uncharacterized protein N7482_010464 [Penicillium canariense]|uniref:Uncharacterized protein n=1 Tax=Penicillium canariense TaxID=189055 RepID=A0A9W9HN05_9EURO|nr:uncharacterized protein N7482_010464 [Penicillium canariense]KAJ5151212.1 hypothetical protein N7482_010464 [Penicillium canariense]